MTDKIGNLNDIDYKEVYDIKTEKEAKVWIESAAYICMSKNNSLDFKEAIAVIKENVGYFAGYCSNDERKRIQEIFKCVHPYFGDTFPEPEECYKMGVLVSIGNFKKYSQPPHFAGKYNSIDD